MPLFLLTAWLGLLSFVTEDAAAVRVEHFVLEGRSPQAVARLTRREGAERTLLEWEVRFAEGPRVLHVEIREGRRQRLVWRDLERGAATWMLEGQLGDARVRETRWGTGGDVHRWTEAPGPIRFPLELLEQLRAEDPLEGPLHVADPLSLAVVSCRIEASALDPPPAELVGQELRVVALLRSDGAPARRYAFSGASLRAFQWREGGPWWCAVERQSYERVVERWNVRSQATSSPPVGR